MRLALLALPLALIAGCTSLTEEECRAGDWYGIGVEDGAEGRGAERLAAHRKACARAGVVPDAEAWLKGRERGLRLYCTPAKAYQVGKSGRSIREGCTARELARMEPAWDWGRQYWRLELEADDLRSDIRALNSEVARLPPDSPRRGALFAERMRLMSRLNLVELRQRRYARWP